MSWVEVDGVRWRWVHGLVIPIENILLGTEQFIMNNKITLSNIKFSLNACKNLTKNDLASLSNTARDFFYFVQSFGHELRDFVNLWVVEDRIQGLDSVTCCIFQIYF